jgi:hypothetical protein
MISSESASLIGKVRTMMLGVATTTATGTIAGPGRGTGRRAFR